MNSASHHHTLVDPVKRLVSRKIFFDEDILREEMRKIFARSWLFVGHESQIPEPGDYITNYMGEDPVIMVRDLSGDIRVFLNSCRHRGMKVCRNDFGNTRTFVCVFHGWSYKTDGRLVGVPYQKEAYGGKLDTEKWGLVEVPKVSNYGGFIFANWDAGAATLDDWLGNAKYYLDITIERPLGGVQFLKGTQRYRATSNWKLMAENFAGDSYHLPYSHGSVYRLNIRQISPVTYNAAPKLHAVTADNGHCFTSIAFENERFDADLNEAQEYSEIIRDYLAKCRARLVEKLGEDRARVFSLGFGNIFPNLAFNNFSALRPMGFYQAHPKAAHEIEMWQWCGIDRDAPDAVKEMVRVDFTRTQAASGIAAQDDAENFEQVTEATRGVIGQTLDFNYQMGLDAPGEPHPVHPGRVAPYFSENNQMNFYTRWAEMMAEPVPEAQ